MATTATDFIMIKFSKTEVKRICCNPATQFYYKNRSLNDLTWSLRLHRVHGPSIRIAIGTSVGCVKATGAVTVGTDSEQFVVTFTEAGEQVLNEISMDGVAEQFFVNVGVKFEIPKDALPFKMPSLNVFELVADSQLDVDFRFVDGEIIKVHRGFLSLISPVFQAMFTHDTKEAKSGVIEVSDFKLTTVKNVINLCYGQHTGVSSTSEVINMLRFADKYDIKAVVEKLEASLEASINKNNFCMIAQYAWDFDRNELKMACGKKFREKLGVCLSPEFFNQMSASTQLGVIATAASIEPATANNE